MCGYYGINPPCDIAQLFQFPDNFLVGLEISYCYRCMNMLALKRKDTDDAEKISHSGGMRRRESKVGTLNSFREGSASPISHCSTSSLGL